jgi:hypothetical protein
MIFRDFEQKIVKIINESGMSIDAIYFIMKNIMREIEEKYFEYCRMEDAAAEQEVNEESGSEDKESDVANNNEEGTN